MDIIDFLLGRHTVDAPVGDGTLPSLTTPASSAHILSGYQAINSAGKVINGTILVNEHPAAGYVLHSGHTEQAIASGYIPTSTVVKIDVEEKTATPTSASQDVLPSTGKVLTKVVVEGDADLKAENIKRGVSIFGVDGLYEGETTGGGAGGSSDAVARAIVDRSITSYSDAQLTKVGDYALRNCSALTSVNLPEATEASVGAFQNSQNLKTVYAPKLSSVGDSAFKACKALEEINFPELGSVATNCFAECAALTSVSLPAATYVGANGFDNCIALENLDASAITTIGDFGFRQSVLTSLNLPVLTSVGRYCFYGCSALEAINLPELTSAGMSAFRDCDALVSAELPKLVGVEQYMFEGCAELASVDLGVATSINSYAFRDCPKLSKLYLRGDAVCTLAATTALDGTPIANGSGSIYVPSYLVSTYQAAANWSDYASCIKAISKDSPAP